MVCTPTMSALTVCKLTLKPLQAYLRWHRHWFFLLSFLYLIHRDAVLSFVAIRSFLILTYVPLATLSQILDLLLQLLLPWVRGTGTIRSGSLLGMETFQINSTRKWHMYPASKAIQPDQHAMSMLMLCRYGMTVLLLPTWNTERTCLPAESSNGRLIMKLGLMSCPSKDPPGTPIPVWV